MGGKEGRGPSPRASGRSSKKVEKALGNFKKNGIDVIMSGRLGEDIRFYCMDTDPVLKMTAETISGHAISMKAADAYPLVR